MAKAVEQRMRAEGKLSSQSAPVVFEYAGDQFKAVEWSDFVRLTVREICRRPFVLKAHGLYFVGDGEGTDIGRVVAQKHPGRVRHIIEWLEVALPYLASDVMDRPLIGLPMRKIGDAGASEVIAHIQKLAAIQREAMA